MQTPFNMTERQLKKIRPLGRHISPYLHKAADEERRQTRTALSSRPSYRLLHKYWPFCTLHTNTGLAWLRSGRDRLRCLITSPHPTSGFVCDPSYIGKGRTVLGTTSLNRSRESCVLCRPKSAMFDRRSNRRRARFTA